MISKSALIVLLICAWPGSAMAEDSPLVEAARANNFAKFQVLLESGDEKSVISDCHGLLERLLEQNKTRFVEAWWRRVQQFASEDRMWFPVLLSGAAAEGHARTVKFLLGEGIDANAKNYIGETALIDAVRAGHVSVVTELIAGGADLKVESVTGDTVLTIAALDENLDVLNELLRAKAELNRVAKNGGTPLTIAAQFGSENVVRRLLEESTLAVDLADSEGKTALMRAAERGFDRIVVLLLKSGAKRNSKPRDGTTAADLARENGFDAIVRILNGDAPELTARLASVPDPAPVTDAEKEFIEKFVRTWFVERNVGQLHGFLHERFGSSQLDRDPGDFSTELRRELQASSPSERLFKLPLVACDVGCKAMKECFDTMIAGPQIVNSNMVKGSDLAIGFRSLASYVGQEVVVARIRPSGCGLSAIMIFERSEASRRVLAVEFVAGD